jgi:RNA recognition motif-containing protein
MFLTLNLGMPCRHLWVGNVEPSVSEFTLKNEFEVYGQVESVRVLRANQCAFINFYREEDASQACEALNGKKLGTKGLVINYQWGDVIKRTSRARRALDTSSPSESLRGEFTQPSRQLFVGNIVPSVTEQTLHNLFSRFGQIEQIKGFTTRGYAFVIFKKIQVSIFVRDFMTREPPELGGRALVVNFGRPAHNVDIYAHAAPMTFPQVPMMPHQFMPQPAPFMHQSPGMGMHGMPLHTQMQGLSLYDLPPWHGPVPDPSTSPHGHLPAHLLSQPSTPTNTAARPNALHSRSPTSEREQALAKRERDIAEREKKLAQREIDLSKNENGYTGNTVPFT